MKIRRNLPLRFIHTTQMFFSIKENLKSHLPYKVDIVTDERTDNMNYNLLITLMGERTIPVVSPFILIFLKNLIKYSSFDNKKSSKLKEQF